MSFKRSLAILSLSLVTLLVASAAVWAQEPVEIVMWTWFDDSKEAFDLIVEQWNSQRDDIKVRHQVFPQTEYLRLLEASIAAGTAPDIFAPHVHVRGYGVNGIIVDLYEWLDEEFISRFYPSTIEQFTWYGKLYALPWTAQTFGFFYHPEIFERYGLEIPETWDDLIEVGKVLRANGIYPVAFPNRDKWLGADFFLPLITQVTDDPTLVLKIDRRDSVDSEYTWDLPAVVEAFEVLKKLVDGDVFAPGINGLAYEQGLALFYTGRAAMFYAGSWVPQTIASEAPQHVRETYDVFPTPALAPGKRHWTANESGANLAVYAHGNVPEAIEFLKFLYSSDIYRDAMIRSKGMPAMPEFVDDLDDPIVRKMTSWLVDGAPHILYGAGSWDAIANAVQGVLGGMIDPQTAAEQVEREVRAAMSR